MKNLPKNYFLFNVKIKNGIDTYFFKLFCTPSSYGNLNSPGWQLLIACNFLTGQR
jgi:hypothetical protein